jgi:hypothetical protein
MGKIRECVEDVKRIASRSRDFDEAKQCIEQLLSRAKAQHHGHRAVAQRVRDQLNQTYDNVPTEAQVCIDLVLDWLDHAHTRSCPQGAIFPFDSSLIGAELNPRVCVVILWLPQSWGLLLYRKHLLDIG